jgi:hypothetical protein
MPDPSFDDASLPPGWEMPTTRLASILAKALMPSQQSVAATLGAPVDGAAWIARKMGVPVPGDMREADPTVQANTGRALAWTPSASIPGSSQYFQNLFDNPPPINALAQTLRRHSPRF